MCVRIDSCDGRFSLSLSLHRVRLESSRMDLSWEKVFSSAIEPDVNHVRASCPYSLLFRFEMRNQGIFHESMDEHYRSRRQPARHCRLQQSHRLEFDGRSLVAHRRRDSSSTESLASSREFTKVYDRSLRTLPSPSRLDSFSAVFVAALHAAESCLLR